MAGRITITDLIEAKRQGRKVAAISCYDYTTARLVAQTDIEMILVGDSAAQVVLGYDSTLPATMDFMVANFGCSQGRSQRSACCRHAVFVVQSRY